MTDENIEKWFTVAERETILFAPVFPPTHDKEPTTFFGGMPKLPEHIPWPEADVVVDHLRDPNGKLSPERARVASTFIGQVDLNELPQDLDNGLPASGTVYFFCRHRD